MALPSVGKPPCDKITPSGLVSREGKGSQARRVDMGSQVGRRGELTSAEEITRAKVLRPEEAGPR